MQLCLLLLHLLLLLLPHTNLSANALFEVVTTLHTSILWSPVASHFCSSTNAHTHIHAHTYTHTHIHTNTHTHTHTHTVSLLRLFTVLRLFGFVSKSGIDASALLKNCDISFSWRTSMFKAFTAAKRLFLCSMITALMCTLHLMKVLTLFPPNGFVR